MEGDNMETEEIISEGKDMESNKMGTEEMISEGKDMESNNTETEEMISEGKVMESDKMETEEIILEGKDMESNKMNTEEMISERKDMESNNTETEEMISEGKAMESDKMGPKEMISEVEKLKLKLERNKMRAERTMDETFTNEIGDGPEYEWNETIQPHLKIAVIGESGCGKSALILAAKSQIFPHPVERFVSKRYALDVEVDGKTEACLVAEADAGVEHIDRRSKLYSESNVILMCFDDIQTLPNVEKKWVRELKDHIPRVPVILVRIKKSGLETDVLSSDLTKVHAFSGLLECCPHARKGVQKVFEEAVRKART